MEQVQEVKTESLYSHAVKHGLILGAIAILLTIVAYATSISFLGSFKFLGCLFAADIAYVIYAGITYRNNNGRYITYGKAFIHGFVLLAIAGLVNFAFGIVLYDVIDPDLAKNLTDAIIANTEETMRSFGAPEATIDETLANMRRDLPEGFTMIGRVKNFFQGLIWYAVFVALTSLAVRKNEPVEL